MSYTPTPDEARYLATMLRSRSQDHASSALADKLDPYQVTAEQARAALGAIRHWDMSPFSDSVAMLYKFIDQHDEAKP